MALPPIHNIGGKNNPQKPTETPKRIMIVGGAILGVGIFLLVAVLTVWAQTLAPYLVLVGVLVLATGFVMKGRSQPAEFKKLPPKSSSSPARPVGYTADGQPIYPVVGYTSAGEPITADRAVGLKPTSEKTNTEAIVALILGFVFPPLAILIGHSARKQIRATGEQGDGLAVAGLVLGYVFTVVWGVWLVTLLVAMN